MQRNLEQTTEGSAAFHSNGHSYYLVYQPVGINDWSIIGIVQADAVNSADQRILRLTLAMISALAVCLLLLLLRLATLHTSLKLQHQKAMHEALKKQKEQTDQLFWGMTQLVDRYAVVDLVHARYEYHEYIRDEDLYSHTGAYQELIECNNPKICHIIGYGKYEDKPAVRQRLSAKGSSQRKRYPENRV